MATYDDTIARIQADLARRTTELEESVRELEALGDHALWIEGRVIEEIEGAVDRFRRRSGPPAHPATRA